MLPIAMGSLVKVTVEAVKPFGIISKVLAVMLANDSLPMPTDVAMADV